MEGGRRHFPPDSERVEMRVKGKGRLKVRVNMRVRVDISIYNERTPWPCGYALSYDNCSMGCVSFPNRVILEVL